MPARIRRIVLSSALVALTVGACTSGSSGAPSGQASSLASAPAATAPTSPASSSASAPAASSPAGSVSGAGAVARPSGSPCDWLDKATIDASLGLSVGTAIPSGGDLCTWLSKAPAGGITLAVLTQEEVDGFVASYQHVPGGRLIPGLGVKASALFVTGQKAPLPNSHAQVIVGYGGWGLSVDVSGPAVTVDEAAALAAAAVSP